MLEEKNNKVHVKEEEGNNMDKYSCPNLVVAKMEELISRPFVGQI